MKIIIKMLFVLSLMSSCSLHNGSIQNSTCLTRNNFKYVKRNLQGTSKSTYFFGLGGGNTKEIVNSAKQNMLAQFPLKDNQSLSNIVVDWKTTIVVPFVVKKCIVSCDIIEFID